MHLLVQIIINFICGLYKDIGKKNRDEVVGIVYRLDVLGSILVATTVFFSASKKKGNPSGIN